MVRKYGLAIDNLLAAQVVTAAGEIVTASAERAPDLFWAIRGGGGNFGIVTEFTFRLAPVGQILGGELMLPASREVLRGYLDYAASAPDDLTTIANLMYAPPAPHVPQERVGELVLSILVCWTGERRGRRAGPGAAAGAGDAGRRRRGADAVPGDLPVHGAPGRPARRVDPDDVRRRAERRDARRGAGGHGARLLAVQPHPVPRPRRRHGARRRRRHRLRPPRPALLRGDHRALAGRRRGRRRAPTPGPRRSGGPSATRGPASTSTSWRTKARTGCARPTRRPPTPGSPTIKRRYDPRESLPVQPEHPARGEPAGPGSRLGPCGRLTRAGSAAMGRGRRRYPALAGAGAWRLARLRPVAGALAWPGGLLLTPGTEPYATIMPASFSSASTVPATTIWSSGCRRVSGGGWSIV